MFGNELKAEFAFLNCIKYAHPAQIHAQDSGLL